MHAVAMYYVHEMHGMTLLGLMIKLHIPLQQQQCLFWQCTYALGNKNIPIEIYCYCNISFVILLEIHPDGRSVDKYENGKYGEIGWIEVIEAHCHSLPHALGNERVIASILVHHVKWPEKTGEHSNLYTNTHRTRIGLHKHTYGSMGDNDICERLLQS